MHRHSGLLVLAVAFATGCTPEQEKSNSGPQAKPQEVLIPLANPLVYPTRPLPNYGDVPDACLPYRVLIESVSDCPARRAALMEQESSCNRLATSPYADGLWQISPPTCSDLAVSLCLDLGPCQPFDIEWSTRCAARLLKKNTGGDYSLMGIRTSEFKYNSGYWFVWEMETAKRAGLAPTIDNAKTFCGKLLYNGRQRSEKHCKESYEYYEHIERRLPKYEGYTKGQCS